jgi:hypothetical protein
MFARSSPGRFRHDAPKSKVSDDVDELKPIGHLLGEYFGGALRDERRTGGSRWHLLCKSMATKAAGSKDLHIQARRHVTAARAFHTGLLAESHKHLHVLAALQQHLDLLRQERRHPDEKLAAAHACCKEMMRLRRLRQPWRDTYDDLRSSLVRARALFRRLAQTR